MAKRKYLGQANHNYIKSYVSRTICVNSDNLTGYAALIDITEVNRPLSFDGVTLYDNGYRAPQTSF